jgi:hypothetical protein
MMCRGVIEQSSGTSRRGLAPFSGVGTVHHRLLLFGSSLTGRVPTDLMSAQVAQSRNRTKSLS